MRNVRFVLSLSLAFSALLGACALPERRPEADFDVRDCPNPGPTPAGTPVKLGSVVNHHECLTLDASESAVFTGGARFQWTATVTPGDPAGGSPRTLSLGSAMTIQGIFFREFPIDLATVDLKLTVTDGEGQTRTKTEQLNLLNRAPSITAPARIVRPRSLDLLFSPFLVVRGAEVQDPDCDYEPAATFEDPISCDVSDVYVQNIGTVPLHGSRCADVPARTDDPAVTGDGLPDPYPEDPTAWCFDIFPIDDVRTPEDERTTRRSAFSATEESIDFQFQFEAVDRGAPPVVVDGSGCNESVVVEGPLGEGNSLACQTVRYEDAIWVARGGASISVPGSTSDVTIPGSVGRVAPDWRRQQPGAVLPALASGAGRDRRGVQWLGGLIPFPDSCFAINTCPHALIGYDEKVGRRALTGLGPIVGVEGAPLGGLWIAAMSGDSAGNPAFLSGGPNFPQGEHYVVYVPEVALPAPAATLNLVNVPGSQLIFLTNFGVETPRRIVPTDAGDLWLATTNTADGSGTLRYLPAATISLGAVIDLQLLTPLTGACAGVDGWTFPGDGYTDVLAPGDNGRVWATDLEFDATDGHPFSRVCLLDGTGAVSHQLTADYSIVSSLAFDPGRTDAPARPDTLWMADAASQSMLSASDVLTGPVAVEIDGYTSGPFADIAGLAVDALGGLWADSHPEPFTRAPLYVDPVSRSVLELERYLSVGRGIEAATLFERSTWRADGLFDIVRAPAASVEIPAFEFAPEEMRLVGVDQVDGAAYAIAPNPNGDNFFRFSADGGVTALGHLAGIPTSGIVLPEVLGSGYAIPATLWLSVVYEDNPVPRLVSITVDRLRQMGNEGTVIDGDLPYCGDGAVFLDRATLAFLPPCWLQQIDSTASGLTFAPREMVLSFEPDRLLVYLLARPSAGNPLAVIAALSPFSAYESGTPLIAATTLAANEVRSILPQPMVAADSFGDLPASGVWLVRNDGRLRRWHLADPSSTTGTTFVPLEFHPVPPALLAIDSNYRAVAGANDRVNSALWVTYVASGRPTELWRYRSLPDSLGEAIVLDSAATIQLSGGGDSLAVAPFTGLLWASLGGFGSPWLGSVWTSGNDGALVRVSTLHDGEFSLVEEYSRRQRSSEDFPVTPTPAGFSILAGGL